MGRDTTPQTKGQAVKDDLKTNAMQAVCLRTNDFIYYDNACIMYLTSNMSLASGQWHSLWYLEADILHPRANCDDAGWGSPGWLWCYDYP